MACRKRRHLGLEPVIILCCRCCISVLYKCVVYVLYLFVLYFTHERNQLIFGEKNVEEQCETEQKNTLKSTALQYEPLLANGNLNNELKLKIQNPDFTEVTIAQLRADIRKLDTKLQQTVKEKKIGFDTELTCDGLTREQRSKIS